MSRIFFISDAHLGNRIQEQEDHRETLLLEFFKYVQQKGDGLIIVGDLFDFWFEYQTVIPRRYFRILVALKKMVDHGLTVEYITGNHDFAMDRFLETDLNIRIHHQPLDITIDGKRLYVAHGDGLAKKDGGYRLLKRILHNPFHIRLYRILHPDLGIRLATFFSNLSRNHREIPDRKAEYIQYARARFAEGFDGVILAHTHQPQEYHEGDRTYINTGDWMENFSYGKWIEGKLSLDYWREDNNT